MQSVTRSCLTAPLAAATWLATAAPITFSFNTTVSQVVGLSGFPAGPLLGDQVAVSINFDSDASMISPPSLGRSVFDPASIVIKYVAGSFSQTKSNAQGNGLFILRDNAPDPDGFSPVVDGLTFIAYDGISDSVQVTLRGPMLDLITNGQLPTFQDDRWANQRLATVEICRRSDPLFSSVCDVGFVRSLVNPVPEPASLGLMLLGMGAWQPGFGGAAQRREPAPAEGSAVPRPLGQAEPAVTGAANREEQSTTFGRPFSQFGLWLGAPVRGRAGKRPSRARLRHQGPPNRLRRPGGPGRRR